MLGHLRGKQRQVQGAAFEQPLYQCQTIPECSAVCEIFAEIFSVRKIFAVSCDSRHVLVHCHTSTNCEVCYAAASVKIMYSPQPTPEVIQALTHTTIRKVACGHNHTLALDDKGAAFTWGEHQASTASCNDVGIWRLPSALHVLASHADVLDICSLGAHACLTSKFLLVKPDAHTWCAHRP